MKVRKGFLRPISRLFSKGTPRGHRPVLYTAALTLGLILTGCGNVSLSQLLEKQDPGELGITPKSATIDEGSSIEITAKGGFEPYIFSATGGSFAELDGSTTYYTAPSSPEVVTVTVSDGFSSESTATITVVSPVSPMSFPEVITIEEGDNTGFVIVTGGSEPYTFTLDGEGALVYHHLLLDRVKYLAPDYESTAHVQVEDAVGTIRVLTITVVQASGA